MKTASLIIIAILSLATSRSLAQPAPSGDAMNPARAHLAATYPTSLSAGQLAALDALTLRAWAASAAVSQAVADLERGQWTFSPQGRLAEALHIAGEASLGPDAYGQVAPRVDINISLDVLKLAGADGFGGPGLLALEARLSDARSQVRLQVVEAYTRLLLDRAAAEHAALALEFAQAEYRLAELGTAVDQAAAGRLLGANLAANQAALALMRANLAVVVATESLAVVTGMSPTELHDLLATTPGVDDARPPGRLSGSPTDPN